MTRRRKIITEEAPTLGKTVLLLRAKTERPEALATGAVRVAGDSPDSLLRALENLKTSNLSRPMGFSVSSNPFGNGGSAKAIVDIVERLKEGIYEPADTAVFQPAHLSVTEF